MVVGLFRFTCCQDFRGKGLAGEFCLPSFVFNFPLQPPHTLQHRFHTTWHQRNVKFLRRATRTLMRLSSPLLPRNAQDRPPSPRLLQPPDQSPPPSQHLPYPEQRRRRERLVVVNKTKTKPQTTTMSKTPPPSCRPTPLTTPNLPHSRTTSQEAPTTPSPPPPTKSTSPCPPLPPRTAPPSSEEAQPQTLPSRLKTLLPFLTHHYRLS